MRHSIAIAVGPASFRIGSQWRAPVDALARLYAGYPAPTGGIADFTVRLEAERWWRRFIRPSVAIAGDFMLPDAVPLPLAHGLLAAEMAMNLQLALGERRFLLLHAGVAEKGGRAVILTGESGAGKSTLAAMLGERGWRFMGDEFALLDPETGQLHPFPRPASLKNRSIAEMAAMVAPERFGPLLEATPKGDIRHLVPRAEAIAAMGETARPAMILFPAYGAGPEVRPVGKGECFVRLTQASTNYVALGEAGFAALTGLVNRCPAHAIDYPDSATAFRLLDQLWDASA